MSSRANYRLKNILAIAALLLSFAAVQCPLWSPKMTPGLTAKSGAIVVFGYPGEIEKATIIHSNTATISAGSPHRLVIHAHQPGRTHLLIKDRDGERKLYDIVVLPS